MKLKSYSKPLIQMPQKALPVGVRDKILFLTEIESAICLDGFASLARSIWVNSLKSFWTSWYKWLCLTKSYAFASEREYSKKSD